MKYQNGATGPASIYAAESDLDANLTPANTVDALIHVVFPQIENASYLPSSYINNTGTGSVTRVKDSLMYDGSEVSIFGKGTLYHKMMFNQQQPADHVKFMTISDGSNANSIYSIGFSTGNFQGISWNSNAIQWNVTGGTIGDGNVHELQQSWDTNDVKIYLNRVILGTDSSASEPPGMDEIWVGSASGNNQSECLVSHVKIYNKVK